MVRFDKSWITFALPVVPLLIAIMCTGIPGCAPPGGTGTPPPDDSPQASVLQSNLDPLDPEGAVLTGVDGGNRLVFFGAKNDAGEITSIQSGNYFAAPADVSPTYAMTLDEQGRLRSLAVATGEHIVLEYDEASETATAYFRKADAPVEIYTLDFSNAPPAAKLVLRPIAPEAKSTDIREADADDTRSIRFFVGLSLIGGGAATEDFATVPDAVVQARVLGAADAPPPGRYDVNEGAYVFDVASRLVDLNSQARDCAAELERYDSTVSLLEYTTGLLFAACTLSVVFNGGCHAVVAVGTYAAFTGLLGWDGGSQTRCESLRRQARDPELGRVSVTVSAAVPRLNWSDTMIVEYDIRNESDPITQFGRADVRFLIPVSCSECAEPLICDGQRCVECVFAGDCPNSPVCSPDGRCVECLESLHCRASSRGSLCVDEQCVGCTTAQQCQESGQGGGCAAGACVECTTDDECFGDPSRPACQDNRCVECTNDQHCADQETGFFCVDSTCRECRDDQDCPGEVCDPATLECVPGEPSTDPFQVIAYTNLDCINGSGPAGACALSSPVDASLADIQLSGNSARPTISWPGVSGANTLILTTGASQRYGIVGETPPDADGNTETVSFGFSSVVYGDYALSNVRGLVPPEQAVALVPGVVYSITLFTLDQQIATLSFQLAP